MNFGTRNNRWELVLELVSGIMYICIAYTPAQIYIYIYTYAEREREIDYIDYIDDYNLSRFRARMCQLPGAPPA